MNWIVFLILTPFAAFISLVLHELSHCWITWHYGGTVTDFKTYPHIRNGHFYFAEMACAGLPYPSPPDYNSAPSAEVIKMERWFTVAPLISASCYLFASGILTAMYHPLAPFTIFFLLDILNWTQGYLRRSGNDGGRYRKTREYMKEA